MQQQHLSLQKRSHLLTADWSQIYAADSTGGGAIPAGNVYTQYAFGNDVVDGPIYYWYRAATGATVVNGTNTAPDFDTGPYVGKVQISTPGVSALSSEYTVNLADATDCNRLRNCMVSGEYTLHNCIS